MGFVPKHKQDVVIMTTLEKETAKKLFTEKEIEFISNNPEKGADWVNSDEVKKRVEDMPQLYCNLEEYAFRGLHGGTDIDLEYASPDNWGLLFRYDCNHLPREHNKAIRDKMTIPYAPRVQEFTAQSSKEKVELTNEEQVTALNAAFKKSLEELKEKIRLGVLWYLDGNIDETNTAVSGWGGFLDEIKHNVSRVETAQKALDLIRKKTVREEIYGYD